MLNNNKSPFQFVTISASFLGRVRSMQRLRLKSDSNHDPIIPLSLGDNFSLVNFIF